MNLKGEKNDVVGAESGIELQNQLPYLRDNPVAVTSSKYTHTHTHNVGRSVVGPYEIPSKFI